MPAKAKAKKSGKYKKRNYKKKSKYGAGAPVPRGPFPVVKYVTLRYADVINMDAGAGTFLSKYFRCNDLFDPDYQTGGHQPMLFDTYSQLYTHYLVHGAKITVEFRNSTSSDTAPVGCALRLQRDVGDAFVLWSKVLETQRTGYTTISNTQTGKTVGKLTSYYSTKKFFNVTDVKDNFTSLGAQINSSPPDTAFWQIGVCSLTGNNPSSVNVTVIIDYICSFHEPKVQPQS